VTTRTLWRLAAVFGLAAATFLPALDNGLLGDDAILIEQRLDPARAPSVPALFGESYWADLHESALYRPLSLTFLYAQRRVSGLDPRPYRVVSLLLHGVCSILVLQLLRRLVQPRAALAGALLFAVHPIHAEAVTTIYGQADLWCALFFLAALHSDRWPSPAGHGRLRLAWLGLLYLLSLLCKEQGVLLPALLIMRAGDSGDHGATRHHLAQRVAVLLVSFLIYATLRVQVLGAEFVPAGDASVASGYPWWARLNLIVVSAGTYLRLLVLPWGQTTYYGHLRDALFGIPTLEIAVVVLAAISFTPLQRALGRTMVNQVTVLIALTLIPVLNLLPIGVVVGERCLYLPSVGVCALAAAGYARLEMRRAKMAVAAAAVAVSIGLALSVRVALRWQTPLRHWETTIADHPRSAGAHARLALVLLQDVVEKPGGPDDPRITQAEGALSRALELNPGISDAWEGRGLLALMRHDCPAAIAAFQRARSPGTASPAVRHLLQGCVK
jgi:protein O-mannosyl-transferase